MQTNIGEMYGDALDKPCLKQIAQWCNVAKVNLEHAYSYAQQNGASYSKRIKLLHDLDKFDNVERAINELLQEL